MFTTTVCAALSAAGLAISLLTAYRRRFRRATKIAALSLVPVGLAMAGLVELGGKVGEAVGDWATDLAFKPSVWGGFGVLAVAVVLWVGQRLVGERAKRKAGGSAPAAAPSASRPALGGGRAGKSRGSAPATTGRRGSGSGDEDFSDIEAILKKHGI
ncbi:hypothetical protein O7599_33775 [Streptomyces sp. WMMC500]|uniref:hypothetical protein n=1 Tax=Streptomyces sp. WMMC500 TaxID=3015154 RepID=UPI00248AC91D|nr:hypothetical protein [Streptomyces sp. WMMC500]WBB60423.1 hypothetical protein O7599_33775 [Streptomyces sp. WMMC500]